MKNDNDIFDPTSIIDEEEVINIDTNVIDDAAFKEAAALVENIKDIYADPEFMKNNPKFATRLKTEVEDLRILMKIRKSDEVAHDLLLSAIGKNSSNASLYRSLSDIQKTILSTTSELSAKIKDINFLLKNIQLELNFKPESETESESESSQGNMTRGSKDFIKQMRNELEKES